MEPSQVHRIFWAAHPTEVHTSLYASYPKMRGFAQAVASEEHFEATFIAALAQTFEGGGFKECLLLMPSTKVTWANEQMTRIVQTMLTLLRNQAWDADSRRTVIRKLGDAIKHILMGSRVYQLTEEPPRWVAFGFTSKDPVPEWLKSGLLPV